MEIAVVGGLPWRAGKFGNLPYWWGGWAASRFCQHGNVVICYETGYMNRLRGVSENEPEVKQR